MSGLQFLTLPERGLFGVRFNRAVAVKQAVADAVADAMGVQERIRELEAEVFRMSARLIPDAERETR